MAITPPIVVDVIDTTDTFREWADKCNALITAVSTTNFMIEDDDHQIVVLNDSRDIDGKQTIIGNKTFTAIVDVTNKLNVTGLSDEWGSSSNQLSPNAGLEVTGTTRIWDNITLSQYTENQNQVWNTTIGYIQDRFTERYSVIECASADGKGAFKTPKLINGKFIELNDIHYQLPTDDYGNTNITEYGQEGNVYYLKNIGTMGHLTSDPEGHFGADSGNAPFTKNHLIWQKDLSSISINPQDHIIKYYGPDGETKNTLDIPDNGYFVVYSNVPGNTLNVSSQFIELDKQATGNKYNTYGFKHANSGKTNNGDVVEHNYLFTDWTEFQNVINPAEQEEYELDNQYIIDTNNKGLLLTTFSGYDYFIADQSDLAVEGTGLTNRSLRLTSFTGEIHDLADQSTLSINDDSGNRSLRLTSFTGETHDLADQSTLTITGSGTDQSLTLTSFTGETHSVVDNTAFNNTATPGTLAITSFTGETHDLADQSTLAVEGTGLTDRSLRLTSFTGEIHDLADQSDIAFVSTPGVDTLRLTSFTGETHDVVISKINGLDTASETSVSISDTGSDGTITFKTDDVNRWSIDSNGHLIPQANGLYDIGSATNYVRDIYLSNASIKFIAINDSDPENPITITHALSIDATSGELQFNGTAVRGLIQDNDTLSLKPYLDTAPNSAAGDARGAQAIDFQVVRTDGTQVASGHRSIILGGIRNKASGTDSVIIRATDSTATGTGSTVIGGTNNNASGSNDEILGSQNSLTSGIGSTVVGGSGCNNSGNWAMIAGGLNHTITQPRGAILGGSGNTVNHNDSVIVGCTGVTSDAEDTVYVPSLNVGAGFKMPTGAGAGYVLTSDANGVGTWTANGRPTTNDVVTVTSTTYTVTTDALYFLLDDDTANGAINITLAAPANAQLGVVFKKIGSTGNVTLTPPSGTIEGTTQLTLTSQYESVTLFTDGTNYFKQ